MAGSKRKKGLVIVESPAKARKIGDFLGKDYDVRASMGHVRDLPKSKLGVAIEEGFEPSYEIIASRKKVMTDLKAAATAFVQALDASGDLEKSKMAAITGGLRLPGM